MHGSAPRNGRAVLLLALACGALPIWGCDILSSGDPERARVTIDGAPGHTVRLVTTTDFDVVSSTDGEQRDVYVLSADTADVASPYDRSFGLGPRTRFYVLITSETIPAQTVTVRVFLDGDRRYSRSTLFGEEVLEFLYVAR